VARQYSGTAGRIENCQVGVFLAYAAPAGRTFLDRELYLSRAWIEDRDSCAQAGIGPDVAFAIKPELALGMLSCGFYADRAKYFPPRAGQLSANSPRSPRTAILE
jgi:SRSO17 transposase